MTSEQVEELVTQLARPIFLYRMAKSQIGKKPGAEKRLQRAHREIEDVIAELFGTDPEEDD